MAGKRKAAAAVEESAVTQDVGDEAAEVASSTGGKKSNLSAAKGAKNDEFYTQWADIEREMNAYLEYDPDVFRGKVVLLPCDDPEWSNFAKFFALHFADHGLKKLISRSMTITADTVTTTNWCPHPQSRALILTKGAL